jgi:hypothetical protein
LIWIDHLLAGSIIFVDPVVVAWLMSRDKRTECCFGAGLREATPRLLLRVRP